MRKFLSVVTFILIITLWGCENKKASQANGAVAKSNDAEQSVAVNDKTEQTEYAAFEFENTEYDFGTISQGDVVDYVFKFKNTGTAPLLISKATASCGCTVPEWPKNEIPVGASGEIAVKFNSKGKLGAQNKIVTINANTKPEVTRLKIIGTVEPKNN